MQRSGGGAVLDAISVNFRGPLVPDSLSDLPQSAFIRDQGRNEDSTCSLDVCSFGRRQCRGTVDVPGLYSAIPHES